MPTNPFLALDPDPYAPLERRLDIRVLILEPARSWNNEIYCRLEVVSLAKSDGRYYEAVSYCWGSDEKSCSMKLNERPYYITDSLNEFLRYRREKDESVTLWIDAICIDQDNLEEKRKQVRLMRDIYLCSNRLTIWLGLPSDNAELAFGAMYYILEGDEFKLPYLPGDARLALTAFFDRPWWTRIWIVQEFIMGTLCLDGSNALLRCGNLTFPVPAFWEVIDRIDNYQGELRQHFPSIQKIVALQELKKSVQGPDRLSSLKHLLSGRSSNSAPSLQELMIQYRRYKASDARDKIYGLLGISQTEDAFFRSIEVNYEMPACELYQKIASFAIKQGDLNLLKHCRGQELQGLPSWVPDWSYFRNGYLLDDALYLKQKKDNPEDEDLVAEIMKDIEGRGEQRCVTAVVADLLIDSDAAVDVHSRKTSLLARIQNIYFHGPPSNPSPSSSSLSIEGSILRAKVVVLDELKTVHPPFPEELELHWEACTEFMVAVGNCKHSTLHQNEREPSPYSTALGREIAFWRAIFGYDLDGEDLDFKFMIEKNCKTWLPTLPKTWKMKEPRVTVLSSGLLALAVTAAATGDASVELGQGMQTNLIPRDWDEEKIAFFQRRFNDLGRTWEMQPYDLHSRPFQLPNVVPDPYLESRPTEYYNRSKLSNAFKAQFKDHLFEDKEIPLPRVFLCKPKEGLYKGPYTAALGRSFFMTKQGYVGLAPPDSQKGDHVALLDGVKFPFILRESGNKGSTYKLVGEAFMDTVIDGELLEERCKAFRVEHISIV